MGHHYVPQRHLRKFEDQEDPGTIWQYSKKGDEPKRVPINSAAQSRGFYEPHIETILANDVEMPGGNAIDTILNGGKLNDDERWCLALHVAVMLKRTPAYREWAREGYPEKVPPFMEKFREDIRAGRLVLSHDIEKAIAFIDTQEEMFLSEMPSSLKASIENPLSVHRILDFILSMHWRVYVSDGQQMFVTSDNPLYYTMSCGLANYDSEFFLPLSPSHLLHACRKEPTSGLPRYRMPCRIVKLVNKLTVSNAHKMVYSPSRVNWLPPLMTLKEVNYHAPTWNTKLPLR